MNHSHITAGNLENRFRCFVYKKQFSGYLLSQSGEAKCNLYTATEGDRTMELKQIPVSLSSECLLPDWMRKHRKYYNLAMTKRFHINHSGTSLSVLEGNDDEVNMECHQVLEQTNNHTQLIMAVNV